MTDTPFPLDFSEVWDAMRFVASAHEGRQRWDGSPELLHLMDVASRAYDHGATSTEAIATSLLHDVCEDTATTLEDVRRVFGDTIAQNVDDLTQRPGECRSDYLTRCLNSPSSTVLAVKFSDRCSNVSGLHTCPQDDANYTDHVETYFKELLEFFMPASKRVPASLAIELVWLTNQAYYFFHQEKLIDVPEFQTLEAA